MAKKICRLKSFSGAVALNYGCMLHLQQTSCVCVFCDKLQYFSFICGFGAFKGQSHCLICLYLLSDSKLMIKDAWICMNFDPKFSVISTSGFIQYYSGTLYSRHAVGSNTLALLSFHFFATIWYWFNLNSYSNPIVTNIVERARLYIIRILILFDRHQWNLECRA